MKRANSHLHWRQEATQPLFPIAGALFQPIRRERRVGAAARSSLVQTRLVDGAKWISNRLL